jgi:Na+(H+)/acetate symporter ActP
MGFWSARKSKSASDFFVAGRSVSVGWNASAISGEYLSAASFMGVAGMVMSSGYDALWYPVCYACGYLFLLLFIAGPLRRFGAYTIPDFAEGRYDSPLFRKIAVIFVLFIGFFYTMPQMKGAGTTLAYIFPGMPYWAGVVLVGAVITLNVALGGMKGITLVQAFQYWAKMFAISVPVFVLMSMHGHYGKQLAVNGGTQTGRSETQGSTDAAKTVFVQKLETAKRVNAGAAAIRKEFSLNQATDFESIKREASFNGLSFALKNALGTEYREVTQMATGDPESVFVVLSFLGGLGEIFWVDSWTNFPVKLPPSAKNMPGGLVVVPRDEAVKAAIDSLESSGACLLPAGTNRWLVAKISEASEYSDALRQLHWIPSRVEYRKPLPAKAPTDATWLNPFGPLTTKAAKAAKLSAEESKPYALLYTYSLIMALVCGTAGLPHILVRFYTNPNGVAAKRTTMWVMILIGVFYLFPPIFGVMGRNLMPSLYEGTGAKGTDKVVLELPRVLNSGAGGAAAGEATAENGKTGKRENETNASPSAGPSSRLPVFPSSPEPAARARNFPWGSLLSGITCAGAFAAFMSTFSGLLVSMTGALAHDVYGRMLKPNSTPAERLRMFKWCAVTVGTVAVVLGCFVEPLQINFMVGQAFAIAAASYFPLLFMSVWWRGMTMKGAAIGMLAGGVCALGAVTLTNFSDLKWLNLADFWAGHPLLRILCEQPALWTVPLAIGLMVLGSKLTRRTVPADVRMKMLVLHAPEDLGLKQEYIREHEGAAPPH